MSDFEKNVFSFFMGGVVMGALVLLVFPTTTNYVYYYEKDGILVVHLEKVGADNVYVGEPNEPKCKTIERFLDDKYGKENSLEKKRREVELRGLVGWYGKK